MASFVALTQTSLATIVIVNPEDRGFVDIVSINGATTRVGFDTFRSGDLLNLGIFNQIRRTGVTSDGLLFSNGSSLDVTSIFDSRGLSLLTGDNLETFQFGASEGINYLRLDVDLNGAFETVLELNFANSANIGESLITRYAFRNNGLELTIPEAVTEFNPVPEPLTSTLGLLGCIALFRRRR